MLLDIIIRPSLEPKQYEFGGYAHMEKRRQHYIPVFYLNYFTDPHTPTMQTPYVWILDKKKKLLTIKLQKILHSLKDTINNRF
jgi:hypothetical protein